MPLTRLAREEGIPLRTVRRWAAAYRRAGLAALAFRDAIRRDADPRSEVCGLPDAFYTDHGGDFTSRHIAQVAADLGVRLIFSQAGQPRGRGKVERFFRTVEQLFLCRQPGYAPLGMAFGKRGRWRR